MISIDDCNSILGKLKNNDTNNLLNNYNNYEAFYDDCDYETKQWLFVSGCDIVFMMYYNEIIEERR